jgi:hypothetical protein
VRCKSTSDELLGDEPLSFRRGLRDGNMRSKLSSAGVLDDEPVGFLPVGGDLRNGNVCGGFSPASFMLAHESHGRVPDGWQVRDGELRPLNEATLAG